MNTTYPSDDQDPMDDLSPWTTITQVSTSLGVPHNAVRSAVRRAVQNGEDWVKKETSEDGKGPIYLINTAHDTYQGHAQRWKQNMADKASMEEPEPQAPDPWDFAGLGDQSSWLPPLSSTRFHFFGEVRLTDLHALPDLCRWLSSRNLQIFVNTLAEAGQENPWQWRWEELHGEGYATSEEALIAALQCWFDTHAPSGALSDTGRLWFFQKRNGSGMP